MAKIGIAVVVAMLAVGCTPGARIDVYEFWGTTTQAVEPGTTYEWDPDSLKQGMGMDMRDPDIENWVRERIAEIMASLGYPKNVSQDPPGILLATHFAERSEQHDFGTVETDIGAIVIEIYDASDRVLIWRGWAESPIDYSLPPGERQKRMTAAIRRLLERFASRATGT